MIMYAMDVCICCTCICMYLLIYWTFVYGYVRQTHLNQSCIDCEPACDEKRQRWCYGRIAWSWCWYGDPREERHESKRKERSIKTHQLDPVGLKSVWIFALFPGSQTTWPPLILVCFPQTIQVEGTAQVHTPTCKAQNAQPEFTLAPSRYVSRVAADWAVPQGLKHSFALFLKFCNHTDWHMSHTESCRVMQSHAES